MSCEVTQRADFECCYLIGTEINAHRYSVEVTVNGPQRHLDNGYVIEFESLKRYLESVLPDKSFLFDTSSNNVGRDIAFVLGQHNISIVGLGFSMSAENLCNYIARSLQDLLDDREPGVTVISAKLRENNNSYVSWSPDFRAALS